ncbi:hypothetical protein NKH18_48125 [Streptomyces sp. M10(2022)]
MEIEHYPDGSIPAHLLDWVWEASPVLSALSKYSTTSGAAILRDGGGTELLLTERQIDGSYLVGALLPSPDHVHVVGTGAPRTIIATTAHGPLPPRDHASCRNSSNWCSWRGCEKCRRTCTGCEMPSRGPCPPWTRTPRWTDSSPTRPT